MRAIMVMFDSLNRHMLPPYGCDWTKAPNFTRLAQHSVTFENCYAGSLPCMPARRELHTGRYNFLHRGWGPLEPYDDSMPEMLKKSGVYTHLVSDHWHYWEEGGENYHTKYNTFEWARGQEGDPWKGRIQWDVPEHIDGRKDACGKQEYINRHYMREEENQSIAVNFSNGLEFIEDNKDEDNWFLQLETFDPHEPFFSPEKYKELYPDGYEGIQFDWPGYHPVRETQEEAQHCINEYAALLSMCDAYLGRVLDAMDKHDMWKDTMLIVNTDHGFLLTEHGWWGKIMMPYYNEIAHTPFFLWDPHLGVQNEKRSALVQTIDIAPTLLEFFGLDIPADMLGKPLRDAVETDAPLRDYALFGQHCAHVNITDGRYVYMRAPLPGMENHCYNYLLATSSYPGSMRAPLFRDATLVDGFSFTKGAKLLRVGNGNALSGMGFPPKGLYSGHLLFDLETDPGQQSPIHDEAVEARMAEAMARLMRLNEAPVEQFERLGLA